jgi:hypothetical protein
MPLPASQFNDRPDIKVFIVNAEGKYLAGNPAHWFFTKNRESAVVLNHRADRVAEQLKELRLTQGIVLEAVPVPLQEIYEACDRCGELFMPFMIHFDGQRFLCLECRSRLHRPPPRPAAEA